ncbi:hypothetical protein Trydic_g13280 [Trypoxylus dichotomus]
MPQLPAVHNVDLPIAMRGGVQLFRLKAFAKHETSQALKSIALVAEASVLFRPGTFDIKRTSRNQFIPVDDKA